MFPYYARPRLIEVFPEDHTLVSVIGMHPMELMYRLGCLGAGETYISLGVYIPTNPPGEELVTKEVPCNQTLQSPNAPSNLVATAVSSSQIDLTWQDNSDNEQGFKIERKPIYYDQFIQIATVIKNINNYTDTDLLSGTVYYYRVTAYNKAGDSGHSNLNAAVTFADLPTVEKIITNLNYYYEQGAFDIDIYNLLGVKLNAVQHSIDTMDYNTALEQLHALLNDLYALTEESIDHVARVELIVSTQSLIEYLNILNSLPIDIELYPCIAPFIDEVRIEILGGGIVTTTLTGNLTVKLAYTGIPNIASVTILHSDYIMEPIIINGVNFGTLYISQDPQRASIGTLNLQTGEIIIIEKVLVRSIYLDLLGLSPVLVEVTQRGTFSPLSLTQGVGYLVGHGYLPQHLPMLGGAMFFTLSIKGCAPPKKLPTLIDVIKAIIGGIEKLDMKSILDALRSIGDRKATEEDAWNLIEHFKYIFTDIRDGYLFSGTVVLFLKKLQAITGYPCTSTPIVSAVTKYFERYTKNEAQKILDNIEKFEKTK
jgi:hypothetical protein